MAAENTVNISHGFAEELFQLLGMGFKGRKVLLSRPALVGDDHHTASGKGIDGGNVLPEPLVIEDVVGGRVDRRIQIEPEEHGLFFSTQFPDRPDSHPCLPFLCL